MDYCIKHYQFYNDYCVYCGTSYTYANHTTTNWDIKNQTDISNQSPYQEKRDKNE